MSQSMHDGNGSGRVLPSEFFENSVLPVLFARLDHAFPEFGWRRRGKRWEATEAPAVFPCRPDRLACVPERPFWISEADRSFGMTWLQYVNGGMSFPKGDDFVRCIRLIAERAGVDASCLDAKKLTPAERDRIRRDHEEARAKAESWRREQEKQAAQEAAKAVEAGRALVRKAASRKDRGPAQRYFRKHRGRRMETLPASILYTPDVGFKYAMIGAVVAVVQDARGEVVGCQRIFIENTGEPVEVTVKGKKTRKATLGRVDGGACVIGEPTPGQPVVLCEGVETGVAIHELTGWCVLACISAGGLERVSLDLLRGIHAVSGSVFIVAGDLDKSLRGQGATVLAADRVRHGMGVAVAELLPSHAWAPELVGEDELPLSDAKSVDWEDVINAQTHNEPAIPFGIAMGDATVELSDPAPFEEAADEVDEQVPPEPDEVEEAAEEQQQPKDNRRWKPYGNGVYPKNQLDAAHEYLLAQHGPQRIDREEGGGLGILHFAGQVYLYQNGQYVPFDGKPQEMIRGRVRRHFHKHCKARPTKETPPRFHYVDADLSKNEVDSVASTVLDEVAVTLPTNDFGVQFWLRPNVDRKGEILTDGASWDRVITDHTAAGLPDPKAVIPTRDGIIDLDAWRTRTELVLLPKTELLFNLGRVEASIPWDEARAVLKGGIDDLETYAWELCPEWGEFLDQTFKHGDPHCAPTVIRELHKVMGNWVGGDLGHHQANIVWLIGPPGSGKSVLLTVTQALMGASNIVSSTMGKLENQFHLSSWVGKRLAMFPDMEIGRQDKRTLVEMLKLISTGDPVSIDRKYLSEVPAVQLGTRIAIAANNMPGIPDPTLAIKRRSLAFAIDHVIPEHLQDASLAARLTTPRSLAGIMLLCLIGIKHIDQDRGFSQPKWHQGLINDLMAQSSEYHELIDQYIEITGKSEHWASEQDLYTLYIKLGERNGQTHTPKRASLLSQLKTCLTGYGWARNETPDENGVKGFAGLYITPEGMELVRGASGAGAGGHDVLIPA